MFLRQSTAQTIRFGPCLDMTNGVTEETALTLAQADMRLSRDGGAFAQKNAAGNATHDSDGWYSTTLNVTDTATVGELILNIHQPANMLPVWMRFYVIEEEVYDDMFAAGSVGYLKPTTAGRDLDVTATGEAGIDLDNAIGTLSAAQMATGAIDADALATDAIQEIASGIWDKVRSDHITAGSFGEFVPADAQLWNGVSIITALQSVVDVRTEMDSNSTRLATLAGGIIEGTTSGTPTTTSTNTDLTGFLDSELNDRVIVFTGGTANGQAAQILTYTATNGVITFAALTTAPAASDPFKII